MRRAALVLAALALPSGAAVAQSAASAPRASVRVSAVVVRAEASQTGARLAREAARVTPRDREAVRREGVVWVKVERAERGRRLVTVSYLAN